MHHSRTRRVPFGNIPACTGSICAPLKRPGRRGPQGPRDRRHGGPSVYGQNAGTQPAGKLKVTGRKTERTVRPGAFRGECDEPGSGLRLKRWLKTEGAPVCCCVASQGADDKSPSMTKLAPGVIPLVVRRPGQGEMPAVVPPSVTLARRLRLQVASRQTSTPPPPQALEYIPWRAIRSPAGEGWCPERVSNPHSFRGNGILSPARLPIPPSGRREGRKLESTRCM